jgi:hypothetical protein
VRNTRPEDLEAWYSKDPEGGCHGEDDVLGYGNVYWVVNKEVFMANATVRISDRSHKLLKSMASREGLPLVSVLDRAVESYRRRQFLEEVNRAYAALKKDSEVWTAVESERAEWDSTLLDGLPTEGSKGRERRVKGRANTKGEKKREP